MDVHEGRIRQTRAGDPIRDLRNLDGIYPTDGPAKEAVNRINWKRRRRRDKRAGRNDRRNSRMTSNGRSECRLSRKRCSDGTSSAELWIFGELRDLTRGGIENIIYNDWVGGDLEELIYVYRQGGDRRGIHMPIETRTNVCAPRPHEVYARSRCERRCAG